MSFGCEIDSIRMKFSRFFVWILSEYFAKDKTRDKKALARHMYIDKFAVAAASCFLCRVKKQECFLWQNVNVRPATVLVIFFTI